LVESSENCTAIFAIAVAASLLPAREASADFSVLYSFKGGSDGAYPFSGLWRDGAGNLYGTTRYGGDKNRGTVFRIAPDGTETVLHTFAGGKHDGAYPDALLIQDGAGNLYGTAPEGGGHAYPGGAGIIFKLATSGAEEILYGFGDGSNGARPNPSLLMDSSGNLYGTTLAGGPYNNAGVVFELTPDRTLTMLYAFTGGKKGGYPSTGLAEDSAGNFYGTAAGGKHHAGVLFRLAVDGTETRLYTFKGFGDGANPSGALTIDAAGNLYGTTLLGGGHNCGTVFKYAADGTYMVLYRFTCGSDGAGPEGLVQDASGNLYGTTASGGGGDCKYGCGTLFKITPEGVETILHVFHQSDGIGPSSRPVIDENGNLYGTTVQGGAFGFGTIFELTQ
jgi:uncharacterized repeat protein (TIGR03803 family)